MAQPFSGIAGTDSLINHLPERERVRLLGFVCALAWADLEVNERELRFVEHACRSMRIGRKGMAKVHRWIDAPPHPEEVDPQAIPMKYRGLFVATAKRFVETVRFDREAHEQMAIFEELMAERPARLGA